ncbi:hypothetical protein [Mucilaginibacter panaciglaebae]|uniref:hypothetical protein n=1 Tax=Mucilaginibacter panaciglaebae TaxID=502331 RepID=UPI0031EAF38B
MINLFKNTIYVGYGNKIVQHCGALTRLCFASFVVLNGVKDLQILLVARQMLRFARHDKLFLLATQHNPLYRLRKGVATSEALSG